MISTSSTGFNKIKERTSVHGVGEFDEYGVLLHDPLDMLTTNSDNSLVVLVGNVEGDGGRHLLFNQGESLLH